jgi:hypothetical protein
MAQKKHKQKRTASAALIGETLRDLSESLEESGLAAGLVFDGHHRTLACRELGREADCRGYTKAVRNGNQTDLQFGRHRG